MIVKTLHLETSNLDIEILENKNSNNIFISKNDIKGLKFSVIGGALIIKHSLKSRGSTMSKSSGMSVTIKNNGKIGNIINGNVIYFVKPKILKIYVPKNIILKINIKNGDIDVDVDLQKVSGFLSSQSSLRLIAINALDIDLSGQSDLFTEKLSGSSKIVLSGQSDIKIKNCNSEKMKITQSGQSLFTIYNGSAKNMNLVISGQSTFRASKSIITNGNIVASGMSEVSVKKIINPNISKSKNSHIKFN